MERVSLGAQDLCASRNHATVVSSLLTPHWHESMALAASSTSSVFYPMLRRFSRFRPALIPRPTTVPVCCTACETETRGVGKRGVERRGGERTWCGSAVSPSNITPGTIWGILGPVRLGSGAGEAIKDRWSIAGRVVGSFILDSKKMGGSLETSSSQTL